MRGMCERAMLIRLHGIIVILLSVLLRLTSCNDMWRLLLQLYSDVIDIASSATKYRNITQVSTLKLLNHFANGGGILLFNCNN